MKTERKILIGGLLSVLVFGGAGLLAASPDDNTTTTQELSVPAAKIGTMTTDEMRISSDDLLTASQGMLRHVQQLADKAAKEKDIIKLNCVNDKLMPLKAELNLAERARRAIDLAFSASDDSARYAPYGDLVMRHDKIKDLRDEADACVGDALTYVGKTDVQVTGPLNPINPDQGEWGNGVEPPTYRTPFD